MALVVLLRGVNVGGSKSFRPTLVSQQLEHLGAVNIGAAGTFVIRERVGRTKVREEMAEALPFQAEIAICEGRDIVKLAASKPFANYPLRKDVVRFLSVFPRRPRTSRTLPTVPTPPLTFPERGKWMLKVLRQEGRFVLGLYRRNMKAIGYLGKLDDMFGATATTRNWNTVNKIIKVLTADSN